MAKDNIGTWQRLPEYICDTCLVRSAKWLIQISSAYGTVRNIYSCELCKQQAEAKGTVRETIS